MTTNTDLHGAMPELPEPAAAQSRFIATDQEWLPCNVAHARMVLAKPAAWAGYEARYLYTAEQVRAAIQQAAVPEGWRLVPVEPTTQMLADCGMMENYNPEARHASPDADHVEWYRAMLAASPAPPKQQPDSDNLGGGECGGVPVPAPVVQYGDRCGCGKAYASCRICIEQMPRHKFWGAGEPDCPQDIKASNGELHTMKCKVCGDGWRKSTDICFAAHAPRPSAPTGQINPDSAVQGMEADHG